MNFAFVEYLLDNKRAVIPITDIKNFKPSNSTDYLKNKTYKAMWPPLSDHESLKQYERNYYDATVLCLAEDEDTLSTQKRLASVPRAHLIPPSTDSEKEFTEKKTLQDERDMESKLLKIYEKRTAKRTESGRCIYARQKSPSSDSDSFSCSDSDDDPSIIPKRLLADVEVKLSNIKKKLKTERQQNQKLIEEINRVKEENRKDEASVSELMSLRHKNAELEAKNLELFELNMELQKTLVDHCRSSTSRPAESNSPAAAVSEEMIAVGDVQISKRIFGLIDTQRKNSLFVKELAVLVWGKEELCQRSVSGKACARISGSVPKNQLTPEKLKDVHKLLVQRLKSRGYNDDSIATELSLANRYIAEKINDLQKSSKRKLDMNSCSSNGEEATG